MTPAWVLLGLFGVAQAVNREVTVLPEFELLLARVVLVGLMLALYGYDWYRLLDMWLDAKDRRRGSTFRALIKSSVLVVLILVVFLGSVNSAFFNDNPMLRDGLRFAGYVLTGVAFVGGIALAWDWLQYDRRGRGRP